MHAQRDTVMENPSVHLSNASIVPTRMHISLPFFDSLVGASLEFFQPLHHYEIPRGTPLAGALNTLGVRILQILCFILETAMVTMDH